MIVRVSVVLIRTVCDEIHFPQHFDNNLFQAFDDSLPTCDMSTEEYK